RLSLPNEFQSLIEQLSAGHHVTAVISAESDDACGNCTAKRRAGGCHIARGQRRRWRGAVIDERHEHRVDQPGDRRRRQLAGQKKVDGLAESKSSHHLVEAITSYEN